MNTPLISICIPTYNRDKFLNECLESISIQLEDLSIKEKVDVFILDNQSEDNTENVVKKFTEKLNNIKYIKDSQKRDIVRGIIEVASLGDGEYIWVLSDDDLLEQKSLQKIINFINKERTDLIICNVTGFSQDDKKINLLEIENDNVFKNKKDFFKFLETKFPISIDYYTTLCSNWIIKKNIFENNKEVFRQHSKELDMFPLPSLFFYHHTNFTSGIISQIIVLNRGDNESWGSKKIFKHFLYKKKLWKNYYKKIIKFNISEISKTFKNKNNKKRLYYYIEFIKQLIIRLLKKMGLYKKIKAIIKK